MISGEQSTAYTTPTIFVIRFTPLEFPSNGTYSHSMFGERFADTAPGAVICRPAIVKRGRTAQCIPIVTISRAVDEVVQLYDRKSRPADDA